jgi:hypothetical protein
VDRKSFTSKSITHLDLVCRAIKEEEKWTDRKEGIEIAARTFRKGKAKSFENSQN